jgi:hypothetical protein
MNETSSPGSPALWAGSFTCFRIRVYDFRIKGLRGKRDAEKISA